MLLLKARLTSDPRQVQTKFGARTVADALALDNNQEYTIWRNANDAELSVLGAGNVVTLGVDSKGKAHLMSSLSDLNSQQITAKPQQNAPITAQTSHNGQSSQDHLYGHPKAEIAQYISDMAKLYNFCLSQVDANVTGISGDEDRRAIATTLYLSASKHFNL